MLAIRKWVAALIVLAGATISTAEPASAASPTDCSQTTSYGDRICLDPTTGYGPLVQIFTPGGTYWNAFPVTLVGWGSQGASVANQAAWVSATGGVAVSAVNILSCCASTVYVGDITSIYPVAYTANATYIAWLQWFTYDPSYPNMEFVIVT